MERTGVQGIRVLVETCRDFGKSREEIVDKLMEKFILSKKETEKYVEDYGD